MRRIILDRIFNTVPKWKNLKSHLPEKYQQNIPAEINEAKMVPFRQPMGPFAYKKFERVTRTPLLARQTLLPMDQDRKPMYQQVERFFYSNTSPYTRLATVYKRKHGVKYPLILDFGTMSSMIQIQEALHNNFPRLYPKHFVLALVQFTKLPKEQHPDQYYLARLTTWIQERIHQYKPRHFVWIFVSLAHLNYRDLRFFKQVADFMVKVNYVRDFGEQRIAEVLRCCGELNFYHQVLFNAMSFEIKKRSTLLSEYVSLKLVKPEIFASMMHSIGILKYHNKYLLQSIASQLSNEEAWELFQGDDIATFLYGMCLQKWINQDILYLIHQELNKPGRLEDLKAQSLVQIVCSFTFLQYYRASTNLRQCFKKLKDNELIAQLDMEQIAKLIHATGHLVDATKDVHGRYLIELKDVQEMLQKIQPRLLEKHQYQDIALQNQQNSVLPQKVRISYAQKSYIEALTLEQLGQIAYGFGLAGSRLTDDILTLISDEIIKNRKGQLIDLDPLYVNLLVVGFNQTRFASSQATDLLLQAQLIKKTQSQFDTVRIALISVLAQKIDQFSPKLLINTLYCMKNYVHMFKPLLNEVFIPFYEREDRSEAFSQLEYQDLVKLSSFLKQVAPNNEVIVRRLQEEICSEKRVIQSVREMEKQPKLFSPYFNPVTNQEEQPAAEFAGQRNELQVYSNQDRRFFIDSKYNYFMPFITQKLGDQQNYQPTRSEQLDDVIQNMHMLKSSTKTTKDYLQGQKQIFIENEQYEQELKSLEFWKPEEYYRKVSMPVYVNQLSKLAQNNLSIYRIKDPYGMTRADLQYGLSEHGHNL